VSEGRIDPEQTLYWTPEWHEGEWEAGAERAAGRGTTFDTTDDFIVHLESIPSGDAG
jgi:hypothetical protein